jgi:predicted metalloprotease with PDZ domain
MGGDGADVRQPSRNRWDVTHAGTVRIRYKVFGDQLDGTFLAVDTTHAHINMPAALMWARGLETRPVSVTFGGPQEWKVATQLLPTTDPRTFTAANLQYLIDSPAELSNFTVRRFVADQEFRVVLHHQGRDPEADAFTAGVEKIVREARAVFGELRPSRRRTFIVCLPRLFRRHGHRNSTILTGPVALDDADRRVELLATVAHEFFHSWNVERIRPRTLEPFRLDALNPSGELWFAEGFTSYYEPLIMQRSGITDLRRFASSLGAMIDAVMRTPARKYRSAEDASRFAQYVDQAAWVDPTYAETRAVIHLGCRHRTCAGFVTSCAHRPPGDSRSLHPRLWRLRASDAARPGRLARPTPWQSARCAGRVSAIARSPINSLPATNRAARLRTTARCSRARVCCCARADRDAPGSGRCR